MIDSQIINSLSSERRLEEIEKVLREILFDIELTTTHLSSQSPAKHYTNGRISGIKSALTIIEKYKIYE